MNQSASIDDKEVEKFSQLADQWWDPTGTFKPLHVFNPVRIEFIRDRVIPLNDASDIERPLRGIQMLDVGCGGGLLSEPMARLGATMTSIDASPTNIEVAKHHARQSGLDINYQATSAEMLAHQGSQFDVVLNMEVIEHVADVSSFCDALSQLVKPNGLLFTATLNRTIKSYALAIVGAEYVLRWLPRGTHDWKKFLKPSEIDGYYAPHGLTVQELTGVSYHPLTQIWSLSRDLDVNFMMVHKKN